ncbi:hypothetical protein VNO80_05556 [Phaseolus coccineus]|uniref:Uncharacterized protein n=1 Tax=Phaseolus coccineus TaxID=3886 RepID=A0AAN9RDT0_PHACN
MEQNRNWYNVKRVGRVSGRKTWETFMIVLRFWLQEVAKRSWFRDAASKKELSLKPGILKGFMPGMEAHTPLFCRRNFEENPSSLHDFGEFRALRVDESNEQPQMLFHIDAKQNNIGSIYSTRLHL